MAWKLEGRYFENCPCDVVCPCTASLDLGADVDRCQPILIFHIDSGDVDGTDVSDLNVVMVADTPRVMTEGNWKVGVLIDEAASDEQADKLGQVFSGALGGPPESLGPLLGENLGVERVAMEFTADGGVRSLRAGELIDVEVEEVVPFGVEDGTPVALDGIFHVAGNRMNVAKASRAKLNAFGIERDSEGTSGFTTEFAWGA